jgi:hypothetical protein
MSARYHQSMPVVCPAARIVALLTVAGLTCVSAAQDTDAARRAYLQAVGGFSNAEVRRVESGRPVTATLEGRDSTEVVTFGAIMLRATPDAVLNHIASLDTLRKGHGVMDVGNVANPPRPTDFGTLTIHPSELPSLSKCKPASCELQFPGWAIRRFQNEVAWRSPGASAQADALAREVAHQIATSYMTGGQHALAPYNDQEPSSRPGDEYTRMLADSQYLPAPFAALRGYLTSYPTGSLPGVTDQLFWSSVEVGLRPTTHISHMVVALKDALGPTTFPIAGVVVSKQLFATHYYSSTLEWHMVVSEPSRSDTSYLFYMARAWAHGMTGFKGRLVRPIVRGRLRDSIERYLAFTKTVVEAS